MNNTHDRSSGPIRPGEKVNVTGKVATSKDVKTEVRQGMSPRPSNILSNTTSRPKARHPETLKLEALLAKYPDEKDEIFDMALRQGIEPDDISSIFLMRKAGIETRKNR